MHQCCCVVLASRHAGSHDALAHNATWHAFMMLTPHSTRSSRALRMLLQTLCRQVLTARRSKMLLVIALDVLACRALWAAEATRRPCMSLVMPTSRSRSFASHGPLGYFRSRWSSGQLETAAVGARHGSSQIPLAGICNMSNKSDGSRRKRRTRRRGRRRRFRTWANKNHEYVLPP